ncbi:MAG TPA: hypothetical protein VN581_07160 [Patescibacteria group bacterium]|nr:hypothetical protein [Patescibacteria group bacterium]
MFDLFAILAAIVFIVLVLQLRAMLAMPFLSQSARLVKGDWAPLLAAEDVIARATQELAALGFNGPDWLSITPQPIEAANVRSIACFRREADGVLVFLVPMFLAETPNRCISYLATRLVDGRTVVSQPSDPFFAITATADEPAQLLAPAAMPDLLAAHLDFVARQGIAAGDACSDATIVELAGCWMNTRRQRLIARGDLVEDKNGIARPRLGFAIRALRAFWSRPKWPANVEPIPPARLTRIAQASAQIRERAPTAAMQWLLFVASNVLFMAVGGVVFGLQFALILLVVIAIHEAGHYGAMRAFGYRNVQMLALPLVGGVTVGHEAHPRATHRAWMSLMGPLPGIVIGWCLLAIALVLRDDGWMLHAAWVFLAINYLNVLPVPPLDGGHIVQAMLPARWYGLRIAFLVLACAAGAAAALAFGLVGLALIVLLQLGQLGVLLQNRRAIRHLLARGGVPVEALRARKLRLAFDALDDVAGPTTRAQTRIAQAEDIVRSLDVVPMSTLSRVLTGSVYAALLAVPLAALLVFVGAGPWSGEFADEQTAPAAQEVDARRQAAMADLANADIGTMVARFERPAWWLRWFYQVPDWPPPARAGDVAAAERRIDARLPDDLREFYARHDGFPMLQLGALADVAPVAVPTEIEVATSLLETPFAVVDDAGRDASDLRLSSEHLLDCHRLSPALPPELARHLPWPALIWCPRLESAGAAIVNTSTRRAYRDFDRYLRARAAEQGLWRESD